MPMYYFHLADDETIVDSDGTDLLNVRAAREHAAGVARELTANSVGFFDQHWSAWTMTAHVTAAWNCFRSPCLISKTAIRENNAAEGRVANSYGSANKERAVENLESGARLSCTGIEGTDFTGCGW